MQNNQTTYGLIGYPISHSLSPLMHNTAFNDLDVEAFYDLFPLKEEELDDFFSKLKKDSSNIFGLNVTVPYKEKVIKYLDNLTPFAEEAMAVNTITISNKKKLVGYNTDGPGFMTHLAELQFNPTDKKITILGAGGAARAIICVLCIIPERPHSIKIFDIDREKANYLISDLGKRINVDIVEVVKNIDDLNIEKSDLLINATPIGMKKEDPCLIEKELLHNGLMIYDLIYNPSETLLLKMGKEQGAKVSNGLGMLFYQGVLAFQHWAKTEISQEIKNHMREALEEGLK